MRGKILSEKGTAIDYDGPFAAGSLRRRPVLGYCLAIGSALLSFAVRRFAEPALSNFPFITFFPAIIVTSYLAGVRPGIVCALLSLVAAWYFFVAPAGQPGFDVRIAIALLFFAIVCAFQIVLIAAMQHALDRLERARRLTEQLHHEQRTLFHELQHRVANNMGFISTLLRLQKRRIAADPASAAAAFDEAVARIETMSRIHRRLYDPDVGNNQLEAHLQDMCDELLRATGVTNVKALVRLPGLRFDLDRLLPLSLLIAELVTNALKHGFVGRDTGTIDITMATSDAGERQLIIRDNGVGLPPEHDPLTSPGLGMRIMHGLVGQIGGRLTIASGETPEGGTVARIVLPD